MVAIKGGGVTYQIASGKKMEWEQVPQQFKDELNEQEKLQPQECSDVRTRTQTCIIEKGFWNEECCALREAFDLCVGNALKSSLRGTKPE
jgi:hypothetical protein